MGAYEHAFADVFTGLQADVTEENIQARIRGGILMAIANKKNALLLCTSNKSELAVGYGTMYGDITGALAVLGDVYKTKVFELANWHVRRHSNNIIPASILQKNPAPSCGTIKKTVTVYRLIRCLMLFWKVILKKTCQKAKFKC